VAGVDAAVSALGCVQDVLSERGKNVHVVAAALALLQVGEGGEGLGAKALVF
jgi:hypothetical protein